MINVNLLGTSALPLAVAQAQLPAISQATLNQSSSFGLVSTPSVGFSSFTGCFASGGLLFAQTPATDYSEIPMSPLAAEALLGLALAGAAVYGVDVTWQSRVQNRLLDKVGSNAPEELVRAIKFTQPSPIFHPIKHHSWVVSMNSAIEGLK